MGPESPENRGTQGGFTLIEVMLVVAIIGLLAALAIPLFDQAITKSRRASLAADAHDLYTALMRYHADHGAFPAEGGFDLHTLSPLSDQGYFSTAESFTQKMTDDELMYYEALDVNGPDTELVAAFEAKADPDIRVLMLHTGVTGEWLDGVYLIVDGRLVRADGASSQRTSRPATSPRGAKTEASSLRARASSSPPCPSLRRSR